MQTPKPHIVFDDVRYTYDGQRFALDGVTLSIDRGEFVCVLGGNGSGKSTLAKHVNALLVPDEGTVTVDGLETSDPDNLYDIRSSAGMVFQNPDDQIVASVIEDDVAFGPENLGVPTDELRRRVTAALAEVGLSGFEKKETATLSGGQKQRVAIAGALALEPKILVLDEASAMLDPRGRKGLLRVCHELNDAGMTILFITHFMEEAAQADRVVVLDGGRIAAQGTPEEVLTQVDLLEALALEVPFAARVSRSLAARGVEVGVQVDSDALADRLVQVLGAGGQDTRATRPQPGLAGTELQPGSAADCDGAQAPCPADEVGQRGEALIEFRGVSFSYLSRSTRKKGAKAHGQGDNLKLADWGNAPDEQWALRDIDFTLHRGEFLGIAGHTGSGKSTLVQLANGLLAPEQGTVVVNGRDISDRKGAAAARQDVGVVFQYPENQLFAATVREDVAFGPLNLGLSHEEANRRVREALQLVHLDFDEIAESSPFALSGGQQRRVALAGVLAMRPTTLILDEPIAGLDPRARAQLLGFIRELHDERGFTIAIVSHNMDDLARLCDRVLVLNQGRQFALGTPSQVFADEELLRGIGLGVPQATHLANELAARGMSLELATAVPTEAQLIDALAHCGGTRAS